MQQNNGESVNSFKHYSNRQTLTDLKHIVIFFVNICPSGVEDDATGSYS